MKSTCDSKRPNHGRVIRGLARWITGSFLVIFTTAYGATIPVTAPIVDETGKTIGYTTEDSDVNYLIPEQWELFENKVHITGESPNYEIFFVLAPTFPTSNPTALRLKLENPNLQFFALPYRLERAELNFLDFIGELVGEISPEADSNQSPLLYYKIELDESGLSTLRSLANGSVALTGVVEYKYQTGEAQNSTSAPIIIHLRRDQLQPENSSLQFDLAWVKKQIFENQLTLDGILDGGYDLGGLMLDIESSQMIGHILEDMSQITYGNNGINIYPDQVNFPCHISFYVPAMGETIDVEIDFELAIELDLKQLSINISELRSQRIVINNGPVGSFFENIIKSLLAQENVRESISEQLTAEFRNRIINQDLFI